MGEYEPDDSRTVTQSPHQAPGEPPRTGPREAAARAQAANDEGEERERDGQPTTRDALGHKQPGYASAEDRADGEAIDDDSAPIGK